MNGLDEKIKAYMEFLTEQGYDVTVHKPETITETDIFAPLSIHSNPYCLRVKSKKAAWDKCIRCQKNVKEKCRSGKPFFGMCYAGVWEYVFPLEAGNSVIGFVCVSGYRTDEKKALKRIKALCSEYGHNEKEMRDAYFKYLNPCIPDSKRTETLIYPLIGMTELLEEKYPSEIKRVLTETNADYIYSHALWYLKNNYAEKITLEALCRFCHCSSSYISHIFKTRSGKSINAYTNELRLKEACRLMEDTNESISEIALTVGFSDPNYFTNLFKRNFGLSPSKYKNKLNISKRK